MAEKGEGNSWERSIRVLGLYRAGVLVTQRCPDAPLDRAVDGRIGKMPDEDEIRSRSQVYRHREYR